MESETGTRFPNFRAEDEKKDLKPSVIKVTKTQRFNER